MTALATRDEFSRLRRRLIELQRTLGAHQARLKATPERDRQALGLVAEGRRLHAELRSVRRRFASLPRPRFV
jgi:hypothetical protein